MRDAYCIMFSIFLRVPVFSEMQLLFEAVTEWLYATPLQLVSLLS